MSRKTCGRCDQEKSVEGFNWLNRSLGKRQRFCRECMRVARKESYKRHRDKHVGQVVARNNRLRAENSRRVLDYLRENPCVDCGESDPVVLQFDHVRGKKLSSVSKLVNTARSWKCVETEMKKCEVRCANCHMRRTAKQFGWKKLL